MVNLSQGLSRTEQHSKPGIWEVRAYKNDRLVCEKKVARGIDPLVVLLDLRPNSKQWYRLDPPHPRRTSCWKFGTTCLWSIGSVKLPTSNRCYWDIGLHRVSFDRREQPSSHSELPRYLRIPFEVSDIGKSVTFEVFND